MLQDDHQWRRNCSNGACVEVAEAGESVLIRGSRDPAHIVRVTRDEWNSFVTGVKNGIFDHTGDAA